MAWCSNSSFSRLNNYNFRKVVKMNTIQIIMFLLAIINLIAITISIYYKKQSLSTALSILEIILVYLSLNY